MAPTNPEVLLRHAQFYELKRIGVESPDQRADLSATALEFRERTLPNLKGIARSSALESMATDALEADDLPKAERYANELLQLSQNHDLSWDKGNAAHEANIVLGRIALRHGDTEGAKQHLLASIEITDSPSLTIAGPNMILAKELLEKGERDVVLTYLESASKFWQTGGAKLQNWIATVKGGGTPDFGGNLEY